MIRSQHTSCYRASLDRNTRPEVLEIHPDGTRMDGVPYAQLQGISFTGAQLIILFTQFKVTVDGSNLKPLADAFVEKAVKLMEVTPANERVGSHTIIARIEVAQLG